MKYTITIDTELFTDESTRIKPGLEIPTILHQIADLIALTGADNLRDLVSGPLHDRHNNKVGSVRLVPSPAKYI